MILIERFVRFVITTSLRLELSVPTWSELRSCQFDFLLGCLDGLAQTGLEEKLQ